MTIGSNTSAPRVKEWPPTPGFWMDFYGKLKEELGPLTKYEIGLAMTVYINGGSVASGAAIIRRERLL